MKEHFQLFCAPMVRAILAGLKSHTRRLVSPENSLLDEKSARTREGKALWAKLDWSRARPYPSMGAFGSQAVDAWWVPEKELPDDSGHTVSPYVRTGDVLVGKETFFIDDFRFYPSGRLPKERPDLSEGVIIYRADGTCCDQLGECECGGKGAIWRPSIFMPKWASRLRLEMTDTFPQRVQDISDEDCIKEGIEWGRHDPRLPMDGYRMYGGTGITNDPRLSYRMLWNSLNAGAGTTWDDNPPVWVRAFKKIFTT